MRVGSPSTRPRPTLRHASTVALLGLVACAASSAAPTATTAATFPASCRTTPPAATVAPWAKATGIDKLSGNGRIYVRLPRWRAARQANGRLHHKMPWLFSPTVFTTTVPVRFTVRNAAGARVGSLGSVNPITLGAGGSGAWPTTLNVPTPGCYRLTAQARQIRYTATLRVY